MAVKSAVASTLNPEAPLFIPAAYLEAEDFSPEWWRLIQTCPAFREYWIRERYEVDDGELFVEEADELESIEELLDPQQPEDALFDESPDEKDGNEQEVNCVESKLALLDLEQPEKTS